MQQKGTNPSSRWAKVKPDIIIVDALNNIDTLGIPYTPIIKGDALAYSISCASIIAKVTRDRIMRQMDEIYPEYGFAGHKGYGTAKHIAAIKEYGLCKIHRRSFTKTLLNRRKVMNILDIISNKRDKKELTKEEIEYFVKGYTSGEIADYQAASLIMAIYLNGMTKQETTNLSFAMAHSGEILNLSSLGKIIVDKHSTGGVGDKVSIILLPLVASLGIPVAKMSGRGLGFTGGTVDKLESIPGYKTQIDIKTFIKNVKDIGISMIAQTLNLAPADKKLYALRDVTSCVESIPLIASSIMSKKLQVVQIK